MSYGPPRGTFLILGLLLGALLGFVYSEWIPPKTALIEDFMLNVKIYGLTLFAFVLGQFILGLVLKRPYKSRAIYLGIFTIPFTWLHSMLLSPSATNVGAYIVAGILIEIPMILIFLATQLISQILPFLVGFNTYILDGGRLPPQTVFSYELEVAKNEKINQEVIKLVDRIMKTTGFQTYRRSLENRDLGWVICSRGKLDQGIFYEVRESRFNIAFFFFELANDTVREPTDYEEIFDYKAQILGLLNDWTKRKIISEFTQAKPNLRKGLEQISEGLGPLRIPRQRIWETIKRFPSAHPYQFAFILALLQILVTVVLFYLRYI